MKRIALISCSAEKASSTTPLQARQLYRSPLFRKSVAWAEQQGLEWFVLSAAYGLIRPADQLMPYDKTLRNMTTEQRAAWAQRVASEIDAWFPEPELEITLLAGEAYAGWIPKVAHFAHVVQPLQGMQIGQRLQFLTDELREGQKELFA